MTTTIKHAAQHRRAQEAIDSVELEILGGVLLREFPDGLMRDVWIVRARKGDLWGACRLMEPGCWEFDGLEYRSVWLAQRRADELNDAGLIVS